MEKVKTEEKSEQILLDIRRQIDLYLQGLSAESDESAGSDESDEEVVPPKNQTLFNQVVQRYREELEKLKDDPEFRPLYIGIKDMGEEIHVWAIVDSNRDEQQMLERLEYKINVELLFQHNQVMMTYYFYPSCQGNIEPKGYTKLFPIT